MHITNGGAPYIAHADILIVNEGVELIQTVAGKQHILKSPPQYFFEIYGVLEDSELNRFIVGQTVAAQTIVAREGIQLQLQQLTLGPAK